MATNISACKDCLECQRGKVTRQFTAAPVPIPIPSRRFSHIHADLVGPLPVSKEGFTHILTIIDRSTPWLEAVPLQSTMAVSCADAVTAVWVSRFGAPDHLTTNREANLPPSSCQLSPTALASDITSPPPSIHNQTAWWNVSIARSRMTSAQAPQATTGLTTFLGCFWGSGLCLKTTVVRPLPSSSMAPPIPAWPVPYRHRVTAISYQRGFATRALSHPSSLPLLR